MKISRYTDGQILLLKGLGILFIVLHNFFHNIPPVLGENEFYFNSQLFGNYIYSLQQSPSEIIRYFFSIWGHYGVQIFIFISAYRLSLAYDAKHGTYKTLIKNRFKTLYVSFVICVFVYVLLGVLKSAIVDEQVLYWDSILWKLLLISNFIPGEAIKPVGPWWFIPFIFQFYLFFPIVHSGVKKFGNPLLIALSIAGLALEWSLVDKFDSINFTFLGHLPLICCGIWLSKKPSFTLKPWLILFAVAVFIGGHFSFYLWLVIDLAVIVIAIYFFELCINKLPQHFIGVKLLSLFGFISLHLFLVNGFLRSPFHNVAIGIDHWWGAVIMAIISLIFSTIFAFALMYLDKGVRTLFHLIINKAKDRHSA